MAGLGLTQAVRAYQQGTEWRQGQEQRAKQQAREATVEEANKAAAGVIDASKAEWALNGAQGQYTPNDTTMFKAAEARGQALAKGGDWQGFIQNEATVQQQRIRVRAGALQRYEQDGDFESLARAAYPTVFDGKEIVGTERMGGMPALESIGREAAPTKFKFKLSDGSTQEVEPEAVIKKLKLSLIDPVKAAEQEVQMNFLRTKAQIEADKQLQIEGERGRQARQTDDQRTRNDLRVEGVKTDGTLRVEGFKAEKGLALAEVNNKADQRRTETSAGATRYSADQGLAGSKYSADKRVEAAGISAGGKDSKGKPTADETTFTDLNKLQGVITDSYGDMSQGALGGTRISSASTMAMARGVQQLKADRPDITLADAIAQVRKDFEARQAKPGKK